MNRQTLFLLIGEVRLFKSVLDPVMLSTLKCGLKKRILRFSTWLITTLTMETFKTNQWIYFPDHSAQIRHILRTQPQWVLVNRCLVRGGKRRRPGSQRGCVGSWSSAYLATEGPGLVCSNSGDQNWSSHQIISDRKFWEVSYALCWLVTVFLKRAAMWETKAAPS